MAQQIFTHRLDNGLVLVAESMPWLESAAFSLLVPAGCARDPRELWGLSNITCEMVQRGCGARDSRRFIEDLENLGASHSGAVSSTHTGFGAAMPAGNLPQVLSIFADMVQRPQLPPDQLEEARLVCLQEIRAVQDDPAQRVMLELRARQYPDPLGRNPCGTDETVGRITLEDIRRYFEATYRPNEAILAVAGRIDWPALRDHVGQQFGSWSPAELPAVSTRPAQRGRLHIPHNSRQTHIGVAYPSVSYRDPEYFEARGAVGVLSDGMSSRLFTEVREKRGLCYSVYASIHSLRDEGSVLCYAGTSSDRAQETLDVLLAELQRLAEGIEPDELDRLKIQIRSSLIMEQESSRARAAAIALDWYFLQRVRTLDELSRRVEALTVEGINRYLAAHPPRDFCIVTLGEHPLEPSCAVSTASSG